MIYYQFTCNFVLISISISIECIILSYPYRSQREPAKNPKENRFYGLACSLSGFCRFAGGQATCPHLPRPLANQRASWRSIFCRLHWRLPGRSAKQKKKTSASSLFHNYSNCHFPLSSVDTTNPPTVHL